MTQLLKPMRARHLLAADRPRARQRQPRQSCLDAVRSLLEAWSASHYDRPPDRTEARDATRVSAESSHSLLNVVWQQPDDSLVDDARKPSAFSSRSAYRLTLACWSCQIPYNNLTLLFWTPAPSCPSRPSGRSRASCTKFS